MRGDEWLIEYKKKTDDLFDTQLKSVDKNKANIQIIRTKPNIIKYKTKKQPQANREETKIIKKEKE